MGLIDDAISGVQDAAGGAADVGGDVIEWESRTRDERWDLYGEDALWALNLGGNVPDNPDGSDVYAAYDSWLTLGFAPGGAENPVSAIGGAMFGGRENGGRGSSVSGVSSWILPLGIVAGVVGIGMVLNDS